MILPFFGGKFYYEKLKAIFRGMCVFVWGWGSGCNYKAGMLLSDNNSR